MVILTPSEWILFFVAFIVFLSGDVLMFQPLIRDKRADLTYIGLFLMIVSGIYLASVMILAIFVY